MSKILKLLYCLAAVLICASLRPIICFAEPGPIGGSLWTAQGAAPVRNTDVAVTGGEAAGAIQAVVQHPTNPNIMYIGAVNGGIWRTFNATASSPTWTPLTDFARSLSITSLEFDPMDPTHNTLVAGLGSYSSLGREGSGVHGLLRTTDGGNTWNYMDGGGILANKNISGVIVRGSNIVVSVDEAFGNLTSTFGIYRSTNSGVSFVQVSTLTGEPNGLPYGRARVLVGDPNSLAILYTALFARNGGTNGVFKSTDTGATWSKISSATMDNLLATSDQDSVRISVGAAGIVCVGIQDSANGGTVHVFRSNNGGFTWDDLGLAATSESGQPRVTTSPVVMAMLADPINSNIVYAAGGYELRCDLSQPSGSQWARLYGCMSSFPPNSGTVNCTTPHSDARNMILDLSGNMILVCDGGIYRRTNPQSNQGDWSSINGNLQVGEMHNIAYDSLFKVSVAGTQDVGMQRQKGSNSKIWNEIAGADGGDVGIDSTSLPGYSLVYLANEGFIGSFSRYTYAGTLNLVSNVQPSLTVTGGGDPLQGQFVTPVKLNLVDPHRLVIGGANSVYESLDQGNTITEIGPGVHVGSSRNGNGLAYGGWLNGASNPDVLYAAASSGVFARTNGTGTLSPTLASFPGGTPNDVALVVTNWMMLFVIDSSRVFMSTNAGMSWVNITGNLNGIGSLRCVRTGPTNRPPCVLVGTDRGVYLSCRPMLGSWSMVGTNLPYAPVFDMEYNQAADVLLVGTLGRGAWIITNANSRIFVPSPPTIGTQPQSQNVLIGAAADFFVSVGGTPPFGYQWLKDGSPISGETNANLVLSVAQPSDNGGYSVVVSNSLDTVTSLVATLAVTGSPPANCAMSAPAGLVSWWTGDGTAADRVGTSHGTLQNGVSYVAGEVRQAFYFDGVDDYVSVPDNPAWAFGTNDFTIELWVNSLSFEENQAMLAYDSGGGQHNKWIFWLNSNNLQFHVYEPGVGGNYVTSSSFSRNNNQWYHVALTRQGTAFMYYLNGSLLSTTSNSVSIPPAGVPLTIGSAEGGFYFNGMLDEIRIYKRALTASEIQAIYAAGTNGMCPPTPLMFAGKPTFSKTNGFVLNASLRSSQSYRVQANTNLATTNWLTLTNFMAGTAPVFRYTNNAATNFPQRFYRIVSP